MPIVSTSQSGLFLFRKLALELELENAPSYIHGLEAEARRLAKVGEWQTRPPKWEQSK